MAVTTRPMPNPVSDRPAISAGTSGSARAASRPSMARQPAPMSSAPAHATARVPRAGRIRPATRLLTTIRTVTGRNARPVASGDSPCWRCRNRLKAKIRPKKTRLTSSPAQAAVLNARMRNSDSGSIGRSRACSIAMNAAPAAAARA